MTSYIIITDAETDPNAPVTSELGKKWRDNPLAIAEGSTGAPYVAAGWHPYDGVSVGDGADGVIYDFSVDGAVASVESPAFADGYEYRFLFDAVSTSNVAGGGADCDFLFALFRETSAAYASGAVLGVSTSTSANFTGSVYVDIPRKIRKSHFISGNYAEDSSNATAVSDAVGVVVKHTTAQKISKAKFSWESGNLDAGVIVMQRRRAFT
jgi:hypothetical protein